MSKPLTGSVCSFYLQCLKYIFLLNFYSCFLSHYQYSLYLSQGPGEFNTYPEKYRCKAELHPKEHPSSLQNQTLVH